MDENPLTSQITISFGQSYDPESLPESPEFLQEMWARRAQQLAQPLEEKATEQNRVIILAQLGEELYGLDTQYVYEIRPAEQITPVPRTPDWVLGVVNLRGRILSVIDLPRFLNLPRPETEPDPASSHLIVIENDAIEVALLAHEVYSIQILPLDKIQPAMDAVRTIRPEFLQGIAKTSEVEGLILLNLPALLADPQLILYEEIL